MGPQLFLIYINDMSISLQCKLSLYADDSALLFSHSDAAVVAEQLSRELSMCKKWLVDNKLSLHVGKTECLLFGSKRRLSRVGSFEIYCEGTLVDRVEKVKYLGVQLETSLDGSAHVLSLLKVCTGRLAFLYRNSSLLDMDCRRILCSALIQPHLDYCCSSWYNGLSAKLKDSLDIFQRKMVRFIYGLDFRAHVGKNELHALSWLSIPDRISYFQMLHLFRIRNDLAPSYLRSDFVSLGSTHSHLTRGSATNFHMTRNVAISPKSFSFTAIRQWNGLPNALKGVSGLGAFKRKLKSFFLSRYN